MLSGAGSFGALKDKKKAAESSGSKARLSQSPFGEKSSRTPNLHPDGAGINIAAVVGDMRGFVVSEGLAQA